VSVTHRDIIRLRPVPRTLLGASILCAALVWQGCATPAPTASSSTPSPLLLSRDGTIRYRLPAGWFDVTSDTVAADRSIWLIRADYAGTLTVRPVHVRSVERADIEGEGLLQVAKLTAALETSSKPGILAREPDRSQINGRDAVSYDVEYSGSGDRTRTVLLAGDGQVYEITALVNGNAPPGAGREIFSALQSFLSTLRW